MKFLLFLCSLIIATCGTPIEEQLQQVLERMNQLEQLNEKQDVEIAELRQQKLPSGITE